MMYSKTDIVEKINEALKNPAILYECKLINYQGDIDNDWYTEIIARELLKEDNIAILRNIPKITRKENYKIAPLEKPEVIYGPENPRHGKELLAKKLYGKTLSSIGEVIDFSTPLEDGDSLKAIDMLTYNKAENTVYIIELRKSASSATLLKCVLRAYTYWKVVATEKMLSDFGLNSANLRKAVLVFKNSTAYSDLNDRKCVAVRGLMSHLGIDLFVLNDAGTDIIESYKY